MKKSYETPQVELIAFASQDSITAASNITGFGGVNWNDNWDD